MGKVFLGENNEKIYICNISFVIVLSFQITHSIYYLFISSSDELKWLNPDYIWDGIN